jgi:hypothetical protein
MIAKEGLKTHRLYGSAKSFHLTTRRKGHAILQTAQEGR